MMHVRRRYPAHASPLSGSSADGEQNGEATDPQQHQAEPGPTFSLAEQIAGLLGRRRDKHRSMQHAGQLRCVFGYEHGRQLALHTECVATTDGGLRQRSEGPSGQATELCD